VTNLLRSGNDRVISPGDSEAFGSTAEKQRLNTIMQVSFADAFDDSRRTIAIGRIRAAARWRAAEDYGADAILDARFEVDGVRGSEIGGVALHRVTATGLAVLFASAV